jgi:hypothetical protein
MWLVLIEPDDEPGCELHTFRCVQCERQEMQVTNLKTAPAPLPPEYRTH